MVGLPNVGKSSLINRLAEEEVAIVTEIPGTTRDAVSTEIVIRGVPVRLVDTAGLRDSEDPVERLGIERAKRAIEEADVILRVEELEREPTYGERPSDHSTLEWRRSLRVINKIDLKEGVTPGRYVMNDITVVNVSAKTGAGMDLIKDWVLESVGWGSENQGTFLARERHLRALQRTLEHVMACGKQVAHLELLAEELRLAQEALGEITGKYTSDDLLGEIFSRFCIGK